MLIEIKDKWGDIILSGEYESIKDCVESNRDVNFSYADFRGADFSGADFRDANLYGANFRDAINYRDQHSIFQEVIRQQKVDTFSESEWAAIAQIIVHSLCWNSIKKRFADVIPHVFEILANQGYSEWLDYWNELLSENTKE